LSQAGAEAPDHHGGLQLPLSRGPGYGAPCVLGRPGWRPQAAQLEEGLLEVDFEPGPACLRQRTQTNVFLSPYRLWLRPLTSLSLRRTTAAYRPIAEN